MALQYVRPSFPVNNSAYLMLPNSVFFRKLILSNFGSFIFFFYFYNMVFSKFAVMVRLAANWSISFFRNHVLCIIPMSTNKKMFWIDAQPIIASVANYKSIWDNSIKYLKRNSMRSLASFIAIDKKITIIKFIFCSSPKPTTICFLNEFHKTLYIYRHTGKVLI